MAEDQALKFLLEDCVFDAPLTETSARELWQQYKATVDSLPPDDSAAVRKHPLSAFDLKAARKFRSLHPEAESVVDFVRVNPLDLVVHQHWISTEIAERYREQVTPEKWPQTALLNPPSNFSLKWRRNEETITFDLPHFECVLNGPATPDGQMRISEALAFATVGLHGNRAILLSGYHRTFACAEYIRSAANPPHGVLFGVSNSLAAMGNLAADVLNMMEGPRPPRMADFFDDRLALPVKIRRRRWQMKIRYEVTEVGDEAGIEDTVEETSIIPPAVRASTDSKALLEEGKRQHRAGRYDAAAAYYERVLILKPDNLDANFHLGAACLELGRTEEAAERLHRTLALQPNSAHAHLNLSIIYLNDSRLEDAAGHLLQAIAIEPGLAEAHHNLSVVRMHQGRFEEAKQLCSRAIAIRPDFAEAHCTLATLSKFHAGDAELRALEATVESKTLAENKAPYIHFALAKGLEDIGDYRGAFRHLEKGNALRRGQLQYDEDRFFDLLRRIAEVFDGNERVTAAAPGPVPIFVVGMPRSGSTLIEQILASHPQVSAAGELPYLANLVSHSLDDDRRTIAFPEGIADLDDAALGRIGRAYLAKLGDHADGRKYIIDKSPINFIYIGLIHRMFPQAKIIHTMRNAVDTCLSCYATLFTGFKQPFSYDLAELGRYYRAYQNLMDHWRSVLPARVVLDVSYEEVVDDLETQARRIVDYCGLPWDAACLHFDQLRSPVMTASAVQVRQPLYRSSVDRWRRYEVWLQPLLASLADPVPVAALARAG